ncbi:MAG: hypothetical protein DWQ48_09720 [Bacteroidetes bacterium]|nr:MAG: hypothetical protein DWQ48_09720 [Bacteroidota bacterium]
MIKPKLNREVRPYNSTNNIMKKIHLNLKCTLPAAAILFVSFFSACKKESSDPADDFQTSSQEIGLMESMNTEVDNMVAQASQNGTINMRISGNEDQYSMSSCAVITNDTVNGVLTIDFGSGCTGRDGRVRSGKIIITHSGGRYFDPGSTRSVTFDKFFVDSTQIEGSRTVVNNGFNSSGNMNWTITATNMKITRPNGNWRSWNGQRTREMTAGYGDSTWVNDVYLINGSGSGTDHHGNTFSTVTSNLVRDNSCHWIISGTITFTPSNRPQRIIDFGNGSCDDLATVTSNGVTRTIHLRR